MKADAAEDAAEDAAAVKIQAAHRGKMARADVAAMKAVGPATLYSPRVCMCFQKQTSVDQQ
jgi:hypothetical protein